MATIILRRNMEWVGMALAFDVELDGVRAGRIRLGGQRIFAVCPGYHTIAVLIGRELKLGPLHNRRHKASVEVDVPDGQAVTVRCQFGDTSMISEFASLLGRETHLLNMWVEGGAAANGSGGYSVVEMVETDTIEEPIGTETRYVRNLSSTPGTRRIRATREFVRIVKIDTTNIAAGGANASVGIGKLGIEGFVSAELRTSYGITESAREEFSEDVSFEIQPQSNLKLILDWKRIWQQGYMKVNGPDGICEVPYKVIRTITFDQSSENI